MNIENTGDDLVSAPCAPALSKGISNIIRGKKEESWRRVWIELWLLYVPHIFEKN